MTNSIALYVHLPWCIRKCPYCDFNSHQLNTTLPEDDYINALLLDLKNDLHFLNTQRVITTIFFGGGTPSLISPAAYKKLLDGINKQIPISSRAEISMEANPGTVEHANFKDYYKAGINRISLGVQSFQADKLKILGRIHGQEESHNAINKIKDAGFDNFNIDIMHSLPEQALHEALEDLQTAIAHTPTHISWYQLTLEPGTNFYHKPPSLPSDEVQDEIHDQGSKLLNEYNYLQYEVSAHSLENNHHCSHNKNYWLYGDYIGIGAGAHGKISNSENNSIIRTVKIRHPKFYLTPTKPFLASQEVIDIDRRPLEFMLNALRLTSGFNTLQFEAATMLPISCIKPQLQKAIDTGFLSLHNSTYKPTQTGMLFHNDLLEIFLAHDNTLESNQHYEHK